MYVTVRRAPLCGDARAETSAKWSKGNEEHYSANVKIKFLPSRLFLRQILYLSTAINYANGCNIKFILLLTYALSFFRPLPLKAHSI